MRLAEKLAASCTLLLNATFSGRSRHREAPVFEGCLFSHLLSLFELNAFAKCVSPKSLRKSDMLLHGKTKIESGLQRFLQSGLYLPGG